MFLRQWLCKHVIYVEDLTKLPNNKISGHCHKCGKAFVAAGGMYMNATLAFKKPPK